MSALAPVTPAATLLSASRFFGMDLLRDVFKDVPESFVTRIGRTGRDVEIQCPCGEVVDLFPGQMKTCACMRVFFNGKRVHAAKLPETYPEVCDRCCEDIDSSAGEWVKEGRRELILCERCLRDVPQ